MGKCLNVIVFYNNLAEVKKYIDSVNFMNVDIAVVVNSDTNGEIGLLNTRKNVKVYDFGQNVGYMNAMLNVIKKVNIEEYKYIILSNTDIEYDTLDFFDRLLKKKYNKKIGCIAPSVFSSNTNSFSNPHYKNRISINKMKRNIFIFKYSIIAKIFIYFSKMRANNKKIEQDSCYVYSPHGCYMIFSLEFIRIIKNYKYGVLLYSEESYIGELLRKYDFKCYYDNTIRIIHNESSVTNKINVKLKFKYIRDSLLYIVENFY